MASIEPSTPTWTRPPLSSYAARAERSIASSSPETTTQAPAEALRRDTSLSGRKRLKRRCMEATQASARLRLPGRRLTPSRWQWLPRAVKRVSSRDIGGGDRRDVAGGHAGGHREPGPRRGGGRAGDRGLHRRTAILQVSANVESRRPGRRQGQGCRSCLQAELAHLAQKEPAGALIRPSLSKPAPRISFGSAPRWPPRISW